MNGKPSLAKAGHLVAGIVAGILLTASVFEFNELVVAQKGYTEGRESVLNETVKLGEPGMPCSLEIPMGALVSMVNAGVIRWHMLCTDQQEKT